MSSLPLCALILYPFGGKSQEVLCFFCLHLLFETKCNPVWSKRGWKSLVDPFFSGGFFFKALFWQLYGSFLPQPPKV